MTATPPPSPAAPSAGVTTVLVPSDVNWEAVSAIATVGATVLALAVVAITLVLEFHRRRDALDEARRQHAISVILQLLEDYDGATVAKITPRQLRLLASLPAGDLPLWRKWLSLAGQIDVRKAGWMEVMTFVDDHGGWDEKEPGTDDEIVLRRLRRDALRTLARYNKTPEEEVDGWLRAYARLDQAQETQPHS